MTRTLTLPDFPDHQHALVVVVPVEVDALADPRMLDRVVARAGALARDALVELRVAEHLELGEVTP
jgi:hypothetical protein